jgi:5'-3' exonuclease
VSVAAQPSEQRRVVLIDLSSLFWNAWHATKDQAVSEAAALTKAAVRRCHADGDLVAICCDRGRSFRKDLLPEYKAQRPEKDHQSLGELDRLRAALKADGYLLWGCDGFEADDVIATACEAATAIGHDVLICSADKDLLQLVGRGVRALRTHNWVEGGDIDVIEKFGVPPAQLGDWLALVGDKSDNIEGAPGVGPTTATALLKAFGSLDAMYAELERDPKAVAELKMTSGRKVGGSIAAAIDASEKQVRLARTLVTLAANAPFDFREIYEERRPERLTKEEPDEAMEQDEIPISKGPGKINGTTEPARVIANDTHPTEPAQQPNRDKTAAEVADVRQVETQTSEQLFESLLQKKAFIPFEYDRALEPRSPDGAWALAKKLFDSRLYSKFQSAEAILATILRGRCMGVPSVASLDVFHVIDGKPYPFAYLIIAMAQKDPDCEYLYPVEADDKHAIWETKNKRNPKPTRVEFTYAQAAAAMLLPKDGKSNGWSKNPEDMLVKSAGAKLARRVYPAATLGLISVEELGDLP